MLDFALHVGVQERHIAFTTTPEYVVFATQRNGCVDGIFHLRTGVGQHGKVGVGRGPVHVARVRKHVGRSPQQFHTAGALLLLRVVDNGLHALFVAAGRWRFVDQIDIVEAVVRRADLGEEFEGSIHLVAGPHIGIVIIIPRKHPCTGTEGIATGSAERMPVTDCKPELIAQRAAANNLLRIVPLKRQWILRLRPFVADSADAGEILPIAQCGCCHVLVCVKLLL